jgi:peptidoglycan/LPS O-acetylase OafA/YrhL
MTRLARSPGAAGQPIQFAPQGAERLDQLQVLRFIAAFAVVLFHMFQSFHADFGAERNYFKIGAMGVDLFFVLSGFVITYSARPEAGPAYFMMRRIARIVPLYWTLTFLVAAITIVAPSVLNSTQFNWANLIRSLFFIPYAKESGAIQPMLFLGWTLNYEMFFYAIFASTLLIKRWSPLYSCAIIVALVVLGQCFTITNVILRFYTRPVMLEFVLGVLLFMLWSRDRDLFPKYRNLLVAGFVAFAALVATSETGTLPRVVQGAGAFWLVALALAFTLPKGYWPSLFVLFGNASYSLYLSHPYVIQAYSKLLGRDHGFALLALGAVLTIGLCIALSMLLFKVIEVRAQNCIIGWWVARNGNAGRARVGVAE